MKNLRKPVGKPIVAPGRWSSSRPASTTRQEGPGRSGGARPEDGEAGGGGGAVCLGLFFGEVFFFFLNGSLGELGEFLFW